MSRYLNYLFILVFILIIYTLFFKDFVFLTTHNKPEKIPDFVFHDITISHFTNGNLEMSVSANVALIYQGDSRVFLEDPDGVSYFNNSFFRFNADSGEMNLDSGAIDLENAYLVYSLNKILYWFDSKLVSWDPLNQLIESNMQTNIRSDNFYIKSDSMAWYAQTQELKFENYPKIYLNSSYEN